MCRLKGGSRRNRRNHSDDSDSDSGEESDPGEGTSLSRRLRSSCWLGNCGDIFVLRTTTASSSAANQEGQGHEHNNHSPPEISLHIMDDEPSALSFKDEAERYLFQEDWLSSVCGVPKRRLTVKNGEDNNPRQQCSSLKEKEEPPTADEVLSWSESFDRLMQCNAGRKVFREFLRSEYSEENMLFWIACEDLKTTENPEMVEEKARLIYEDYISILSPKEVSLDSRVRELINRSMVEPTPKTFDEAQLQIYTLMHRDSYPRFLNSNIYKKLMEKFADPPQQ